MKTCSFFGHRNTKETKALNDKIKSVICNLIENDGVEVFLFGSNSNFDLLCHDIVTQLKIKYPNIQRRAYTCRSEGCVLEKERANLERLYSNINNRPVTLLGVEEEVEHKTKWTAGRAQYVERNQTMIDDSDFCVFYYDESYKPPERKQYRKALFTYQPKSGTKLAYEYARRKKKVVINLFSPDC